MDDADGDPGGRTITIAVTGHRPGRLSEAEPALLRARVREVLTPYGAGSRPILLSPLAEGADRLVAVEALALGYRLRCPLPFPREDYLRDFQGAASRAEFSALLTRAERVIELPRSRGSPADADEAYVAVGHYLVSHADLLLAIWDGQPVGGQGGTQEVVRLALMRGLPVTWVEAAPPHDVHRLLPDGPTRASRKS